MGGHYFCFVNFLPVSFQVQKEKCSRIQDRIQARRYCCKGTATICDCVRHQREIEESLSDVEASLTVKPPRNNLLMINLVGYTRPHCSLRKTIKTEPLDIQEAKSNMILRATEKIKHPMVRSPHLSKNKLLRNRSITSKMLRRCPQQQQEDLNDDQAEVTDINLQDLDAGKLNEKLQQLPSATNKRQQKLERSESQERQRPNKQKAKVSQPGAPRNAIPKQKTTNHQKRTRCQSKLHSNPIRTREIPPLICCKNMIAKNQQNTKNKGQDNKGPFNSMKLNKPFLTPTP